MARKLFKRKRSTPGTSTTRITRTDDVVLAARYTIAGSVAVASVVMSYAALAELNARGHIADQWRWVWPVIVVAPELAGALAVIAAQRRKQDAAWSWFLLILATTVSVAANIASAPADHLSQVVHGAVPVVGFIQVKDVCNGIRKRLETTAAAEASEAPAAPQPLPAPERVVIRVPVVEPPLPVPPKPTAPPPSLRSVPRARNTRTGKTTAMDRYKIQARKWRAEEPGITGSEIGRRLGKSDRYGRNIVDAIEEDDRKAAASATA